MLLPFASNSEAVCPLIKVFFVYLAMREKERVYVCVNETNANEIHEETCNRSIESLCNYTYVIRSEIKDAYARVHVCGGKREKEWVCVCLFADYIV